MMSSEFTRSGLLVWGGGIVVVGELYLRCSSWLAAENHKKGSWAVRVGEASLLRKRSDCLQILQGCVLKLRIAASTASSPCRSRFQKVSRSALNAV